MTTNVHGRASSAGAHRSITHFLRLSVCWLLLAFISACGGGGGGDDDSTLADLAFATQPVDASAVEGGTATLTVEVRGEANLQWQRLQSAVWIDLPGAQSARFTLAPVQASDSGAQFRVVATSRQNPARQIVSSVVTLTAHATAIAPAIIIPPFFVTAIDGQDVSFSVTATGTSLSYRWQRIGGGMEWADIAGATAPTLTLKATLADDGAQFRAVVTNDMASVTSATAQLGVGAAAAPSFVINPADTIAAVGHSVTFTATVTGAPAPMLRWQRSADGSGWADIAGATGYSFTIDQPTASDDGKLVRVVATNLRGEVASAAARVLVRPAAAPAILTQPQDASLSAGENTYTTFTVQASGAPSVTYQWQVSVDGGITFTNVNSATSATLTVGFGTLADNGKRFRVVVTNSLGSAISAAAQLRVAYAPFITSQPSATTWRPGQLDAYFMAASGGSDLQLQWQLSSDNGASWTDAGGATGTSYVHAANASASVNAVRMVASNSRGSAVSAPASLQALDWQTVEPRPLGGSLLGVAWRNTTTVFAVGAQGAILRSADAGLSWSVVSESDWHFGNLTSLAFDGNGTAITGTRAGPGRGNLPIKRSVDGGQHWVTVQMPVTDGLSVAAFSNTGAFCLAGNNGKILRSLDAGLSWAPAVNDGGTNTLNAMAFNADGVGVVVGDSGTILRSINGGANWARVFTGVETLTAVAFASRDIVFAAGVNGALLRSADAGQTWQLVASGTTQYISGIHFASATVGAMTLAQGGVMRTSDGGATWSTVAMVPSAMSLYAVRFGADGNVVAVGEYGTIARSGDAGQTWATVARGGSEKNLKDVAFATPSTGVAVGIGGQMLRSTDGGLHWTPIASGTTRQLNTVVFFDAAIGVAMGVDGTITRTANGGQSWSALASGTTSWLFAVARSGATSAVAASDSGLLRTADAGLTWAPVPGASFTATGLAFNDTQVGLAVGGNGRIHRSTDGGLSWTPVTSGTVTPLLAVTFATSSRAFAVGWSGLLLQSDDAGATWQVRRFEYFSDYGFRDVVFISPTTGVAVGDYGTVMATRDGGATWYGAYSQQIGGMEAVARAGAQGVVAVGYGGVITRNDAP